MRVACPKCKKFGNVPDDAVGKTASCPKCKTAFKIPVIGDPVDDSGGDKPNAFRSPTVESAMAKDQSDWFFKAALLIFLAPALLCGGCVALIIGLNAGTITLIGAAGAAGDIVEDVEGDKAMPQSISDNQAVAELARKLHPLLSTSREGSRISWAIKIPSGMFSTPVELYVKVEARDSEGELLIFDTASEKVTVAGGQVSGILEDAQGTATIAVVEAWAY